MSKLGVWRAQSAQIAPSPIGCGNGRPQVAHHGAAKKVIDAQQAPHNPSMSSTVAPQARQRGGRTPSTTARVIRRNRAGRVAASCITAHHQSATPHVKLQSMGPPAAMLFDRRAWRLHRERAAGGVDFLHREVAERLIDRLDLVNRAFPIALDLGAREGMLARLLAGRSGAKLVVSAEPALN